MLKRNIGFQLNGTAGGGVFQPWAVFVAYVALLGLVRYFFPPAKDHGAFLTGIGASTVGLFVVCWFKGEPPSWRWGQ